MQLWFARNREVTLREQLLTQVVLAILSEDLAPGERLPSTRELARRFRLHPNTVSAGYRQLERDGWLEFRRGSGVYVRAAKPQGSVSPEVALDQAIASVFRAARWLGVPLESVRARLRHWLKWQPPDHFLLIEPDEELRRIAVQEMQQAVRLVVKSCGPRELGVAETLDGTIPVVLPSRAEWARRELPPGIEVVVLQISSVQASLKGWLPAPTGALVGVVSRWPGFLKMARAMLAAAGFDSESLVFRDARKANWRRGLEEAAAVVCDSRIAAELRKRFRVVAFTLLSEDALAELRRYEKFLQEPHPPAV